MANPPVLEPWYVLVHAALPITADSLIPSL